MIKNKYGIVLKKGTVVKLDHTVNGYNKFVITNLNPITVHYVDENFSIIREYEYNVNELLGLDEYDDSLTIIGELDALKEV